MKLVSAPIVLGPPCLSNSADISPSLAALLSFSALIALSASSSVVSANRQVFGYRQRVKRKRDKEVRAGFIPL